MKGCWKATGLYGLLSSLCRHNFRLFFFSFLSLDHFTSVSHFAKLTKPPSLLQADGRRENPTFFTERLYDFFFFFFKNNSHISKQLFIKPSKHIICTGGCKGWHQTKPSDCSEKMHWLVLTIQDSVEYPVHISCWFQDWNLQYENRHVQESIAQLKLKRTEMQDYSREMQLLAPSPFLGTSFHFALGFWSISI